MLRPSNGQHVDAAMAGTCLHLTSRLRLWSSANYGHFSVVPKCQYVSSFGSKCGDCGDTTGLLGSAQRLQYLPVTNGISAVSRGSELELVINFEMRSQAGRSKTRFGAAAAGAAQSKRCHSSSILLQIWIGGRTMNTNRPNPETGNERLLHSSLAKSVDFTEKHGRLHARVTQVQTIEKSCPKKSIPK
jgi:hypothetical protein